MNSFVFICFTTVFTAAIQFIAIPVITSRLHADSVRQCLADAGADAYCDRFMLTNYTR